MTSNSHPVQTQIAADNCEVLRARLAKYEDADGRPVAVGDCAGLVRDLRELAGVQSWASEPLSSAADALESQAREIERLTHHVEQQDDAYALLSLDAGRKMDGLEQELAALEALPRGVVLPELLKAAIMRADDVLHALSGWESSSVKLEQRHGADWLKEIDAIRRELHIQLARLNSSPVIADLTASECACGDQYPANSYGAGFMAANNGVCENCDAANSVSAGVVDDRAAFEVEIPSIAATFDGLYLTPVMPLKAGDHLMTIAQHLLIEKQIRAALTASAPNHSEQVRANQLFVRRELLEAIANGFVQEQGHAINELRDILLANQVGA